MDLDLHTLWRGFQSALFFYVSCAPCTARTLRKKREEMNEQYRQDRRAFHLAEPNAYRQASPYRTNEYWAEEIRLGPGPPARRVKQKRGGGRLKMLSRNATDTIIPGRGGKTASGDDISPTPQISSVALSSYSKQAEGGAIDSKRWKSNQREDEDLWGDAIYPDSTSSKVPPTLPQEGGHVEKFPRLPPTAAYQETWKSPSLPGNPPINDLHPPVVSNPAFSIGSNMWMLQPPPAVAIMKGYDSPSNSRSRSTTTSSGSRNSRHGGSGGRGSSSVLGRNLSHRLVEEKLRKTDMLFPSDLGRVRPNHSENAEALRIEASYYEHKSSNKTMQSPTSHPSTDEKARSRAQTQNTAAGSSEKSDSGVEIKNPPTTPSKQNLPLDTLSRDFAFNQNSTFVSSASIQPLSLDKAAAPTTASEAKPATPRSATPRKAHARKMARPKHLVVTHSYAASARSARQLAAVQSNRRSPHHRDTSAPTSAIAYGEDDGDADDEDFGDEGLDGGAGHRGGLAPKKTRSKRATRKGSDALDDGGEEAAGAGDALALELGAPSRRWSVDF